MNASEITNLFLPQMNCKKKLNSFKTFYKIGASFSKELLTCRLQVLEAAEFLDSSIHLTFTTGETMVTLLSMLFLFTKFILIFELRY